MALKRRSYKFLLYNIYLISKSLDPRFYFWSMEPQRESAREGHVEEGVRVALLKLVTDGSRPRAEISDS